MELTTGTEEAETLYGFSSKQDALAERTLLPIYHPFLNKSKQLMILTFSIHNYLYLFD